ncbi:hypothetical protein BU23DRAFT_258331 [Bimuria novae-zelandiae CBS 107.79]|uniref:Heterokaryon incompatibility domain-containing protein n=1 Tax=Bimuria novae-zelandiae CBS 107.79 TaxID=1447943 RepID=A0A6A5UU43_9PLEO|nr:hypothetical protein BU23DRAFT_258331 [Bimuria novae-zelandiae CBS 107.79]
MEITAANPRKRKLDHVEPLVKDGERAASAALSIRQHLQSLPDRRRDLCVRCGSIDFHAIRMCKVTNSLGIHWLTLGARDALKNSHCPLCQLWYYSSPRTTENSGQLLEMVSFASNKAFRLFSNKGPLPVSDIALLGVVERHGSYTQSLKETGYISIKGVAENSSPVSTRLIQPTCFDTNLARYWLNYCSSYHTVTCSSATTSAIPSLRVIDCEQTCQQSSR